MDYSGSIQISDNVFWIGTFDDKDSFQCNSYLIAVDGKGIIIDPGSMLYFDSLLKKIAERIELRNISSIIIQHQDPDVCGNIAKLAEAIFDSGNKTCTILTHSRNFVLVRHYGVKMDFEFTNTMPGKRFIIGHNHELEFIHTPYLHAPGAIATYFHTDKILFSSDIFGGMTDNWSLFAGQSYFDDIASFHKDYMPSKELLRYAMTKFELYDIEKIAPQHGSVIDKEQATILIETFKNFDCGLYIDQSFREELRDAQEKIEEQNRIMSRDLSMAGHFQQTLLPENNCIWKGEIDISYFFKPYREVSGDFIIIDELDDNLLGLLIVDVVDHGVMSGLATIQIKTLFDEYKNSSHDPVEILKIINDKSFSISENDIFFTALYGIFDIDNFKLEIASAGGIPVMHYDAGKDKFELINIPGTSLGIVKNDKCCIGSKTIDFSAGDIFIMQTDGIIETTDNENLPFDRAKSQKRLIGRVKPYFSSKEVLDGIIEEAEVHKGRDKTFDDDITIAAINILTR